MPFPSSSATVPTLTNYQFSWLGYTFGYNTPFEITKIEGLDISTVRTGDSGRARDHGRFIGLDLMDGRDITITGQILLTGTNWEQMAAVIPPGGVTEAPLWFTTPYWGTLAAMVRVRKHTMPLDIQAALGQLADIVVMFSGSDPRLYGTPTQSLSVSPPGTGSGFSFPLSFPLSFGGGSVAGALSVTNLGNIETRPLLTVTGPCTNPSITLASASNSPVLAFTLTMNSGDQLVIDTDMHTATYYTSGSSLGSSRIYTLQRGSQWFTLPAASTSTLQFLTGDSVATGTLTCEWASAYIL